MKKTIKVSSFAKTVFMTIAAAGIIVFASCKKEVYTKPVYIIVSEDDIAESIIRSVASSSNGITAQIIRVAHLLKYNEKECDMPKSEQASDHSQTNQTIKFLSGYKRDWLLNCNINTELSSFSYTFSGNNAYDAPNMSSTYDVNSEFNITGFENNADEYTYYIDYMETGDKLSKVGDKSKFNSSATYRSKNIKIDKRSNHIVSGTIAVTLNNTNIDGSGNRYSANIVFSNNDTATLTFDSGGQYTVDY